MSNEYPSLDSFGIVSTGDPDEDRKALEQCVVREKRFIEGICLNGCAPMVLDDPYNKHCPVCGCHVGSNVPFKDAPSTANVPNPYEIYERIAHLLAEAAAWWEQDDEFEAQRYFQMAEEIFTKHREALERIGSFFVLNAAYETTRLRITGSKDS